MPHRLSFIFCLSSRSLSSYNQKDSEAVALVFQLKASNSIFTTFYHKIQEIFQDLSPWSIFSLIDPALTGTSICNRGNELT